MSFVLTLMLPFVFGWLLDFVIGKPNRLPNPARLISSFALSLEENLRDAFPRTHRGERNAGNIVVLLVALVTLLTTAVILATAWFFKPLVWFVIECVFSFYVISARNLYKNANQLYNVLDNKDEHGDLSRARLALSRMTDRETERLNRQEIINTAVATIAHGTTRYAIAPMFFLAIGGSALGMFYKAADVLYAKLGGDGEKYRDFGVSAVALLQVFSFIPAKISTILMRISARTLHFNVGTRTAEIKDIVQANNVMMLSSFLGFVLIAAIRTIVLIAIGFIGF